jgi:hypothetical protein
VGAGLDALPELAIRRRVALLLLLTAAAAVLWQAPFAFDDAGRSISRWAGVGPEQRELEPARAVAVDPHVLLAARRLIPRRTIYYVAPGRPKPGSAYLAYRPLSFYWLFPRRYTNDPQKARWVLSFGGGLERLGLRYSSVWRISPGVGVAEVFP